MKKMNSIIITGATSGIGLECATEMAKIASHERIIIACRNQKAGNECIAAIQQKTGHREMITLPLDFSSLASVRQFSDHIASGAYGQISTLVNNAGGQYVGGTRYTADGFEETFGVNHLAPFYLTLLLLPYLEADGRIVFTASGTHDPKQKTGMPAPEWMTPELMAHPEAGDDKSLVVGQRRYTTSKLCNVLTVYELQRRLKETTISVNGFDPGFVPGTGLARSYSPFLKFISGYVFKILILLHPNVNTAKTSGKRLAQLAYAEQYKDQRGKYFEGLKEIQSSEDSYNTTLQSQLWKGSVKLTGIKQEDTIIPLD